ncbi:hypothetical protein PYW07_009789 [Mythimna separata]|uniref:Lipase domain-containing protein n=1 Tax=Mythimna separata TaxID=271217 RepID=A0AAD7YD81_MYTSE|nr:hypothetical protein PYW07_009789 [Mythimna separata]
MSKNAIFSFTRKILITPCRLFPASVATTVSWVSVLSVTIVILIGAKRSEGFHQSITMNPCLIFLVSAIWLTPAAAQFGFINTIKDHVTKEVAAIAEPIHKTIVSVGFSQCRHVKKLLGVDYDSYNNTEPDMSELTLNFITRNVNVTYKLTAAAALLPQSAWLNPRKPLKIYLHGFTDDPSKDSFSTLGTAFLEQGDFNIVALDASSLISGMYLRSTTMVRFIGQELGKILAALVSAGLHPSNIHLIGHSLGSHISGFAGKTFMMLTGHRVGRISGLDPAGPCFSDVNVTFRLNVNDADFVDVIHTDAGVYGLNEQVGHVDFYPNTGSNQPSCLPTLLLASCSHSRAWLLFAESVSNLQAFPAVSCADWDAFRSGMCDYDDISLMGYAAQPGASGAYFLQTAGEAPFGLGVDGIRYVNNEGLVKSIGNILG